MVLHCICVDINRQLRFSAVEFGHHIVVDKGTDTVCLGVDGDEPCIEAFM